MNESQLNTIKDTIDDGPSLKKILQVQNGLSWLTWIKATKESKNNFNRECNHQLKRGQRGKQIMHWKDMFSFTCDRTCAAKPVWPLAHLVDIVSN